MRGGLDRLQKELDTLTYNSRSVLNALIRSTVSGGSSTGYTVSRAGKTFVLTRVDIYRLYKFYQAWEVQSFTSESFTTILTAQDAIPVRDENGVVSTNSTTDALVAHSQILYYISSDTAYIDTTNSNNITYWLNKIQNAQNPKLVSNFAPIPLNLRTPTFDENMSTKEYSQFETYLFPASYYSTSILGYQGDVTDHFLNGNSWTISTDEYISLETYSIATGMIDSGATYKTKNRRNYDVNTNGGNTHTYSTNFGYDTHSRGNYSMAGGIASIVTSGSYAGIALGNSNLASGPDNCTSIGGLANIATSYGGSVFGGYFGTVTSNYGAILGGYGNTVGSSVDLFTISTINSANSCLIIPDNCTAQNQSIGSAIISIAGDVREKYTTGDTIRMFNFTYTVNGSIQHYYEQNGDGFNSIDATVEFIAYDSTNNLTIITTNPKIPYDANGGSVARIISGATTFGMASTAMGVSNIASGMYQTVVGLFNYVISDNVLLIVGNGNDTTSARSNVLEVRTDGIDIYGVSYPNQLQSHFYVGPTSISQSVQSSSIYADAISAKISVEDTTSGQYIGLFVTGDGSGNGSTGVELRSSARSLIIRNNSLDLSTVESLYTADNSILSASAGLNSLYGAGGIQVVSASGYDMTIASGKTLGISWKGGLSLIGNTFGALPTNDEQMPYWNNAVGDLTNYTLGNVEFPSNILKTGFYELSGGFDAVGVVVVDCNTLPAERTHACRKGRRDSIVLASEWCGALCADC